MYVLFQITAVTVLLLLAQESLRRARPWAVWAVFLLLPLVLTSYWIRVNDLGFFPWLKFYTVFFCVSWGTALRFTPLGNLAWLRASILLLLAVNIFEAATVDLLAVGLAHAVNGAAGLLLIVMLPFGKETTQIESKSRYRDMFCNTSLSWVVGYTLWNWTFVYLNYPSLAGHHTAVLAAGLMIALKDPRRWVQARASTLGVNLLFCATYYNGMIAWMDTSAWFNEQLAMFFAVCALTWMLGCAVQRWRPQISQAVHDLFQREIPAVH